MKCQISVKFIDISKSQGQISCAILARQTVDPVCGFSSPPADFPFLGAWVAKHLQFGTFSLSLFSILVLVLGDESAITKNHEGSMQYCFAFLYSAKKIAMDLHVRTTLPRLAKCELSFIGDSVSNGIKTPSVKRQASNIKRQQLMQVYGDTWKWGNWFSSVTLHSNGPCHCRCCFTHDAWCSVCSPLNYSASPAPLVMRMCDHWRFSVAFISKINRLMYGIVPTLQQFHTVENLLHPIN